MEASSRHRKRPPPSSLQHPSSKKKIVPSHGRKKSSSQLHQIDEVLESTVIVKNLESSSLASPDELRDFFQNYGDVTHVRLVSEQSYGLVTFDAKEIAHGVIVASNSKEGIRMGNSKRKVQISWASSGLTPKAETRSKKVQQRLSEPKRPKKVVAHAGIIPQQAKSRLFISAFTSAVASTNPELVLLPAAAAPSTPKKPLEVTLPALPNRQVIAYDDWL